MIFPIPFLRQAPAALRACSRAREELSAALVRAQHLLVRPVGPDRKTPEPRA